jgi:hypothetical protein|tara:strand:+ start:3895 stop:4131 length:237 start_codon:yes stop_codon:yes gene_type:complete
MKKIEKDELDKLVELNKNYRDIKFQIADIEITFERLKNQKITAIANLEMGGHDLATYQKEIAEKYGEVDINLMTGEYS